MNLKINIEKKSADFIVMALILLCFAGIVIAAVPNPGHSFDNIMEGSYIRLTPNNSGSAGIMVPGDPSKYAILLDQNPDTRWVSLSYSSFVTTTSNIFANKPISNSSGDVSINDNTAITGNLTVNSLINAATGNYLELKPKSNYWGVVIRNKDSSNYINIESLSDRGVIGYQTDDGPLEIFPGNTGKVKVDGDLEVQGTLKLTNNGILQGYYNCTSSSTRSCTYTGSAYISRSISEGGIEDRAFYFTCPSGYIAISGGGQCEALLGGSDLQGTMPSYGDPRTWVVVCNRGASYSQAFVTCMRITNT